MKGIKTEAQDWEEKAEFSTPGIRTIRIFKNNKIDTMIITTYESGTITVNYPTHGIFNLIKDIIENPNVNQDGKRGPLSIETIFQDMRFRNRFYNLPKINGSTLSLSYFNCLELHDQYITCEAGGNVIVSPLGQAVGMVIYKVHAYSDKSKIVCITAEDPDKTSLGGLTVKDIINKVYGTTGRKIPQEIKGLYPKILWSSKVIRPEPLEDGQEE